MIKKREVSTNQRTYYSQKTNWYKYPEITKEVDTFYIYATEYIMTSFDEGAPDYATLDNEEMLAGVEVEYIGHATTFDLCHYNLIELENMHE